MSVTPSSFSETCGQCGYQVSGPDRDYVEERVEDHVCPDEPLPFRWYQAVFNPALWAVIGIVALVSICLVVRG